MTKKRPSTDGERVTSDPLLLTPYFLMLALLSGSGLFLEIALTRLFSTLFFPPYVFAIISVAVLGIGLGAAIATGLPAWRNPGRLPLYLTLTGYTTLALLVVSVWTASIDLQGALLVLVLLPYLFIDLRPHCNGYGG